jgi:hypothetical protein
VCWTNSALHHEDVWGSGCIYPHFPDLCSSWRCVAALQQEKEPPGTRWVKGSVDPSAYLDDVEKRTFFTLPGLELRPLGRLARSQSLYRLRYPGSYHNACIFYKCLTFNRLVTADNTITPLVSFLHLPRLLLAAARPTTHNLTTAVTGRATAQAVSRWIPTAVWWCGILWWAKVALGQISPRTSVSPAQSTFLLLLHNHLHYHPRLVQ